MSWGFGSYVTVVGVGLIFATLLTIGLLSEGMKKAFRDGNRPSKENLVQVATMGAIMAYMDEGAGVKTEIAPLVDSSHWEITAKIEALRWDEGRER